MQSKPILPLRLIELPAAGLFDVPRYVSRVDSKKWRGWQVRWPGFSRFFSDAAHGSAAASLAEASCFAQENYPIRVSTASACKGITVQYVTKSGRGSGVQVYVVAHSPCIGQSPRKLYAGIRGTTATAERIQKRWLEAEEIRREWLRERNLAARTFYGRSPSFSPGAE